MRAYYVAALSIVIASLAAAQPTIRPPNVVFILADDWGWGDLGCYGNRIIRTPNLDHLAKQGILYTNYYVNGSVCSPTRCALTCGRFPARCGMHGHLAAPAQNAARGMPNFLDPKIPTLPRILQGAGYVTGHFGKWHISGGPGSPRSEDYGFTEATRAEDWEGGSLWDVRRRPESSKLIIDRQIEFIEKHKDQPFYVNTWLLDVHAILNPTDDQMRPYKQLTIEGVRFHSPMEIFASAATDADMHVGRLLKKIDELGLAQNTIVIFSSDNGPEEMQIRNAGHSGVGSTGPFRGRKRSLYEGGVRLPFIVRWPAGQGERGGGKVDDTSVVSGVDLLPTIAKLAGVKEIPEENQLDGIDVGSVWRGEPMPARPKPLMWEWRFHIAGHVWNRSPMLAMREGNWKLLMNPDRSRVELYDIPRDAMEANNVADKHADVVGSMGERLLAWQGTLPKGPHDPDAGSGVEGYPWPSARYLERPAPQPGQLMQGGKGKAKGGKGKKGPVNQGE